MRYRTFLEVMRFKLSSLCAGPSLRLSPSLMALFTFLLHSSTEIMSPFSSPGPYFIYSYTRLYISPSSINNPSISLSPSSIYMFTNPINLSNHILLLTDISSKQFM